MKEIVKKMNLLTTTLINLLFYLLILMSYEVYSQHSTPLWKFENIPVWSDEFNNSGLPDTAKWRHEIGGDGWGNNELQYYTNSANTIIEKGVLKIIAKKEYKYGKNYTSSRLITKYKGDWMYGRIEIKAKLPKGRGTWPAIWMLPTDETPGKDLTNGEIDILEHLGLDTNKVHFSIHTEIYNSYLGNPRISSMIVPDATNSFHVYRMDWTPYGIRGYVDDKKYFEYTNENLGNKYWPFNKRFFLIINIAIGGDWGGLKGVDNKIFPAILEIDYVRVYKFLE